MPNPANARMIEDLYTAFQKRDGAAMVRHYHEQIWFTDPVFGDLRGPRVAAMWRMLLERAPSLEVTFRDVHADDTTGRAHWEATYPYSATGRRVHNVIEARFEFADGKIIRHQDTFDLWRWSSMALGPKGRLLGWLKPVQNTIRSKAVRALDAFEARTPVA